MIHITFIQLNKNKKGLNLFDNKKCVHKELTKISYSGAIIRVKYKVIILLIIYKILIK